MVWNTKQGVDREKSAAAEKILLPGMGAFDACYGKV
jgi:hypothetical protein